MTVALTTSALFDVIVAMVAVPLLVIFSLLLESNMRGEWTQSEESRWNVLALGLALLFVSLLVCCYVIHRLGICIWRAHNRDFLQQSGQTNTQNRSGMTSSTDSQLNLVVNEELPPSYQSVLAVDLPPAYCEVIMNVECEKMPSDSQKECSTGQKMTQR